MISLHKVFTPCRRGQLNISNSISNSIKHGWVAEGPRTKLFEQKMAKYLGNPYSVAVNSCTSALTLALRLAGVGPGDYVISTPMTCMATNEPIDTLGANIIWADVSFFTGNIDPISIKARIKEAKKEGKKIKAIMVVHWGGYPCDMSEINFISNTMGIPVIEDCAHALGSTYGSRKIGRVSDFCCFSFQAIKHIHTGDGGLLTCRNKIDYERAKKLRWFGIDRENRKTNNLGYADWDVEESGYKFHMNDIAANIGLENIEHLDWIIETRRKIASYYKKHINNKKVQILAESKRRESSYFLFTILVEDQVGFINYMKEKGIECGIVHSRNDQNKVFEKFERTLPGVSAFCSKMVCIPIGQWAFNSKEYITRTINEY